MNNSLVADIDRIISGTGNANPEVVYKRLREDAPVLWHSGMGVWIITRYNHVKLVLKASDLFCPLTDGPGAPIFGRTILQMSGKEHSRKTAIISRKLRNPKILSGEIKPVIEDISRKLLLDLSARAGVVDLKLSYTSLLPLRVITHILNVEDGVHWVDWYNRLAAGGVGSIVGDSRVRDDAIMARESLFEYLDPILHYRRSNPGNDLLSDIAAIEFEGVRLTNAEGLAFVAFLLTAGVETTDRVLTSLVCFLASRPDLWQTLQQDASLILPACAEALRFFPPVQGLTRQAAKDVEIGGKLIKKGERVLAVLASGNRDSAYFDEPDSFELSRFSQSADRQFTGSSDLLSFGFGEHFCTGSQLARLEMSVALADLLRKFEILELADTQVQSRGFILRSPEKIPIRL